MQDNNDRLDEERKQLLRSRLIDLSAFGGRCDVTFFNRKPVLNVKVPEKIVLALGYGAGAKKMAQILSNIEFSDGTTVGLNEIWMILPMPKDGISDTQLAAADISTVDDPTPNGKSMREMIREMYHCETRAEEDQFLRRFIAS